MEISATSQNTHEPRDKSEKSTIQKLINTTDKIIVLRKNNNVPLGTPDTLRPRVMGVTKNNTRAVHLEIQRSVHLFSMIKFPIKMERVISG